MFFSLFNNNDILVSRESIYYGMPCRQRTEKTREKNTFFENHIHGRTKDMSQL